MDAPLQFGRYRVLSTLSEGRTGTVYLVAPPEEGAAPMALKALAPSVTNNPVMRERFIRGARATSVVRSPHVVPISEVGVQMPSGQVWCVMERIEGRSLKEELAAGGGLALAPPVALLIAKQLCAALGALHAGGVVHRNVKPANVLLTEHGQSRHFVRLVGFSLVKVHEEDNGGEELTARGAVLGTPTYMAPEALMDSSQVDQGADIYALGVVMYEMFSGRLPWGRLTTRSVIDQLVAKQSELPPPGIEPLVDQLLARMLSPDRRQRPCSMDDVLGALAMSSLEDDAPTALDLAPAPQFEGLSDPDATMPGKRRS